MSRFIFLIVILFYSSCHPVYAQDTKVEPLDQIKMIQSVSPCGGTKAFFNTMIKQKQELLFEGIAPIRSIQGIHMGDFRFFVNQDTQQFTVVISFPDGNTCMLTTGVNFEPYDGKQPWE